MENSETRKLVNAYPSGGLFGRTTADYIDKLQKLDKNTFTPDFCFTYLEKGKNKSKILLYVIDGFVITGCARAIYTKRLSKEDYEYINGGDFATAWVLNSHSRYSTEFIQVFSKEYASDNISHTEDLDELNDSLKNKYNRLKELFTFAKSIINFEVMGLDRKAFNLDGGDAHPLDIIKNNDIENSYLGDSRIDSVHFDLSNINYSYLPDCKGVLFPIHREGELSSKECRPMHLFMSQTHINGRFNGSGHPFMVLISAFALII